MRDFPDSDWKVFRRIHKAAMGRFCAQVLADTQGIVQDAARTPHERYLDLYQLLQDRDSTMARLFNDPRRSVAFHMLVQLHVEGLLLEEELLSLSPDTRGAVRLLAGESPD